jgi:acetylornithine deacetylase/succinyl-diaminopimelate desuccinylase-like protein
MATASEWLARLVQIPSVTPPQAGPRAGAPGEARLAAAVARWFAELGGAVEVWEVAPGRPSVYGVWGGRGARVIGLDVHLDTAGVEQMAGEAFGGELRGGRVYGRGAVDTKASLAVALALLEERRHAASPSPDTLVVAATADEEETALGAPAFAAWARGRGIAFDELAVAEPTGCAPVHGHKGVVRLELTVAGASAHSSQPELGRNAIAAAARVALALEEEHARLQAAPPARLGQATLSVTLIGGGRGVNVIPDTCSLAFDRRVLDGEDPEAVGRHIVAIAEAASPLPIAARTILSLGAFWQDPGHPWLRRLAEWSGETARVVSFGTNAWAYAEVARACVVLGPGSIAQAHSDDEWVEVAELERLATIYRRWWGFV